MRRTGGDQHVAAEERAMLWVDVEIGLARERIGEHFGRLIARAGQHGVVERLRIGRRSGLGLALPRHQRARKIGLGQRLCGFGLRLDVFRQQFGEGDVVFLGRLASGHLARNQRRQQAAEPPDALDLDFRFGLERLEQRTMRVARLAIGDDAKTRGDLGPDDLGLGQASGAELAARHRAFVGLHHLDARLAQPCDIPPGRFVEPHLHVHRRHREHRLVGREDQRGRKIVGDARSHLGE